MCQIVENFANKYAKEKVNELNIELAMKMLADNEPLEKIVRYTSLTIEEVEALRSNS